MKKQTVDCIIIGLALFAMYFGAGNLIFPPLLGQNSGEAWMMGFLFFFAFDMGLAVITLLSFLKIKQDNISGLTSCMGDLPSKVMNCVVFLCLGPFLAIPRTAATTFELGIMPIFTKINSWVFTALFFACVLLASIKSSKVIDIIGKFLTPVLFICLSVIVILGIVNPMGTIEISDYEYAAKEGTLSGYQTLDCLGSIAFITIIIQNIREKGYKTYKETTQIVVRSSIIASTGIFFIYGGLTYLGATTGSISRMHNLSQTELVVSIIKTLFGEKGYYLVGIIVLFACLTTSIGLTSAMGSFFEKASGGKIKYKLIVILVCLFSYFTSNIGVSNIIKISSPVLLILYPGLLILVFFSFFKNHIKDQRVCRIPVYTAMTISFLDVMGVEWISKIPLATLGFSWLAPTVVSIIIVGIWMKKNFLYRNNL